MSSPHGWLARRYSSGGGSWAGASTRACSSAASGMTQGEIVVANDLARNGPSGRDSNAWMSRALQSISRTTPNTCAAKSSIGTGRPAAEPVPTTKPSSASKSSLRVGARSGRACPGAIWPCGRATGVPLTTTVPAAVVADRHLPPVPGQARVVRAEDPARVGRVLERGVEVGEVGHLERQVQGGLGGGHGLGDLAAADEAEQPLPGPLPGPRAAAHEGVQRRRGEDLVAERPFQVDDVRAEPGPDPGALRAAREHAVRQGVLGEGR